MNSKHFGFALMALTLLGGMHMTSATETSRHAQEARKFLDQYQKDFREKYVAESMTMWKAANTGTDEAFAEKAKAELAFKKLHSDGQRFKKLQDLLTHASELDPLTARALTVAELEFKENQLPAETLQKLVDSSNKIEQTFNTFRADLDGKRLSNNDLLDLLEKETNSERRKAIWSALKQVGAAVAPDLIQLAKLRNEAARQLGYANYWDMRIRLQEHDPARILALFAELDQLTEKPFVAMKKKMDSELAKRFKVPANRIQAWHYDNPFFQDPPPSAAVNLDQFYEHKKKEEIVEIARKFFGDIGLPIGDIIERSDLYEREGKDQHAFCNDMDREGDVRTLQNVRPNMESMDTMLHEMGHAVYSKGIDRALPFNLRNDAHTFTTEAIAMLFGALASSPEWMIQYAGADAGQVRPLRKVIIEQRRRQQLVFARWTLVMLHFEKALYENPDQDLNTLWWTLVERYQKVPRPEGRNAPDWASKPHITSSPVYYHNYQMGELFASQIRATLVQEAGGLNPKLGSTLGERVFRPGMRQPWPIFVREATSHDLTARHFASELK